MPPTSRAVTAALAWAVAVVAATAIGLTAVGAIGAGIVGPGPRPLAADEVDRLLAATTAPQPPAPQPPAPQPPAPQPPAPQPGNGAPTTSGPAPDVLAGPGGTVLARCAGGVVEVVSASPAQGFRVHDEDGEDAGRVRFEAEDVEVEMRLSCVDGRAVSQTSVDD